MVGDLQDPAKGTSMASDGASENESHLLRFIQRGAQRILSRHDGPGRGRPRPACAAGGWAGDSPGEETRVGALEFRQTPWIKPDYKTVTLDALGKIERYWRQYSPSALRLQSGVRSGRISFAD